MKYRFIFLLVILSILLLITCFYHIDNSNTFKLKHIYISYTSPDQTKQLYWKDRIDTLKNKWGSFKGKNLWNIRISKIKKTLSKEAWIKKLQVQRKWPNALNILLTPKKVLAIEVSSQGLVMPLSENGEPLDPSPLTRSIIAPVLRYSKQYLPQNNKKVRAQITHLLSRLPDQGYLSLSQIDEITVEQNEIYLHILKERMKIQLGEKNIPIKIARVEKVLEYLKSQNITSRVIDAHLSQKVLVRPYKHR